jgi:hypothetical protein
MLSAQSREAIANFPYRQIVGSLLYLTIWTRPDIAYAVHSVAKHCANPTLEAMHAYRRILGYIKHTLHLGLSFHPGDLILKSFVDSSFIDDSENCKFYCGPDSISRALTYALKLYCKMLVSTRLNISITKYTTSET